MPVERYARTLLDLALLPSAIHSRAILHCGGLALGCKAEGRRSDADMVYIPGLIVARLLRPPLPSLSQHVDPQIPSHGVAPRLTNAPVYKGYLSSGSLDGGVEKRREEVALGEIVGDRRSAAGRERRREGKSKRTERPRERNRS